MKLNTAALVAAIAALDPGSKMRQNRSGIPAPAFWKPNQNRVRKIARRTRK